MKIQKKLQLETDLLLSDIGIIKADPYDVIRKKLQNELLNGWSNLQRDALNEAIARLSSMDGLLIPGDIDEILDNLSAALGKPMAEIFRESGEEYIIKAYDEAVTEIVRPILHMDPEFGLIDEKAISWILDDTTYWVGNNFDQNIRERLARSTEDIISQNLSRKDAGILIRDQFDDILTRSGSYWEGLANHTVTRSREFGHTEGYVKAEIQKYRVAAVMDDRTSPICREMNGKEFKTTKAVELRDRLLEATDPEQVKDIAPWVSADEVKGKSPEELPIGMSFPPYHFSCRTRTVAIVEDL